MAPLSPKRRSELRAEAHKLRPIVLIGDKGLTDEVVAEIDRSLKAHELIKVRAASSAREQRDIWLEAICERLQAHPVQQIGKVFVLYRENPEEKNAKLGPRPLPPGGAGGDPGKAGGDSKRRRESTATMKARVVSEQARERQRLKDEKKRRDREEREVKRTSRPRSRTPSPLPESEPRRRRPRTSR